MTMNRYGETKRQEAERIALQEHILKMLKGRNIIEIEWLLGHTIAEAKRRTQLTKL